MRDGARKCDLIRMMDAMNLLRAVPILTVANLRSATEAYRQVLGLDILMDHGWIVTLGSGRSAQFSLMERDETAVVNPVASLQVNDVDQAFANVMAGGFEIVHELANEAWGVRRFFFRDADGNVINVLAHTG